MGGTVYSIWLGMGSYFPIVGRSDPTALVLTTLAAMAAWPFLNDRICRESLDRNLARLSGNSVALGLLGSLAFLTNWRFAPIVAAIAGMALISTMIQKPLKQFFSLVMSGTLLGFAHPDCFDSLAGISCVHFQHYYKHFFGFFSGTQGGWGIALQTDLYGSDTGGPSRGLTFWFLMTILILTPPCYKFKFLLLVGY